MVRPRSRLEIAAIPKSCPSLQLPMNPFEFTAPMTRQPVVEMMDPMMVEIMRNKTPAQRLAIAFRMWDSARIIVKGGVEYLHPDWSVKEVEQEISLRMRGSLTQ